MASLPEQKQNPKSKEKKMEWIKTILPLLGVLIGFGLAESGKFFADKKKEKRKLKKLLFYLLELRFHFAKELSIEIEIEEYINKLKNRISDKFEISIIEVEQDFGNEITKNILKKLFAKSTENDNKLEYLETNIDIVLNELAEIFPIFAYELSGKHNIKERLNKFDDYLKNAKEYINEIPFDLKSWLQPKLTMDMLKDIDESIEEISGKIDNKTKIQAKNKIKNMIFNNNNEMDAMIEEYLNKIVEQIK